MSAVIWDKKINNVRLTLLSIIVYMQRFVKHIISYGQTYFIDAVLWCSDVNDVSNVVSRTLLVLLELFFEEIFLVGSCHVGNGTGSTSLLRHRPLPKCYVCGKSSIIM